MTSNEGPEKNVIIFQPPMCFTCENARTAVKAFDEVLTELEDEASRNNEHSDITVPINILSDPLKHKLDSDDEDDDDYEFCNKRRKIDYEDMD